MRCLSRAILIALWVKRTAGENVYDTTICGQKSYTDKSRDLVYTPNAWNADDQGFQCMSVRNSPPAFDATWEWPTGRDRVHSYPHVKLTTPDAGTVPLSNISYLRLSTVWSMGTGSSPHPAGTIDESGMTAQDVIANVAFDIFADHDPDNAHYEVKAETEIMIWLGTFGKPYPLGWDDPSCCGNTTVGGVEFNLYRGKNQRGTMVFTWIAESNQTSFHEDISPLIQHIWRNGLLPEDTQVGLISFGTEAYYSTGTVTFSAPEFDICLLTGEAPLLPVGPICPRPKSTAAGIRPSPWLSGLTIIGTVGAALYII